MKYICGSGGLWILRQWTADPKSSQKAGGPCPAGAMAARASNGLPGCRTMNRMGRNDGEQFGSSVNLTAQR